MGWIAWKMLTGERSKYFGIVFGIAFGSMLMAQQSSIFCGIMLNTTAQIQDIRGADIWVMAPHSQYVDEVKPLSENDLYRVRGVSGVSWAVRLYKGISRAQLSDGRFQQVILIGLDDASLVGAPPEFVLGCLVDIRRPDAVILDEFGFRYLWPGEPYQLGKRIEMNDRRAVLVGICKASPTFLTFPVIYTRYSQAMSYIPPERRTLSYVLAQGEQGLAPEEVCERIKSCTGLLAVSRHGFAWKTVGYYLRRTGIPINFGITVGLGFLVGCAIAGQTFYLFTVENLKQFGILKAMGVSHRQLVGMVLLQALVVGSIGYALGIGLAAGLEEALSAYMTYIPKAAFMTWYILIGCGVAVFLIVAAASLVSLHRVLVLEPAIVFRG